MRKLSNVFLKVSIILNIICLIVFALCALACFILVPFAGMIVAEAAQSGGSGADGTAMTAAMFIAYMVVGGLCFLFAAPAYIVAIVLASKARKDGNRGLCIANIVLGAMCGNGFNVAAGIIGLCAIGKEQRDALK